MTKTARAPLPIVLAALLLASLACSVVIPGQLNPTLPVVTQAAVISVTPPGLPSGTPISDLPSPTAAATQAQVNTPLPTLTPSSNGPAPVTSSEEQQLIDLYARVNPSVAIAK